MILAWDNKVDGATVTAGSEIVTLPGSNVKTPHLAEKWHTAAGVKNSHVLFDMGSQVPVSMLAVLGTNLSPNATFWLRGSATDPAATSNVRLNFGVASASVKTGYGAIYKKLPEVQYPSLDAAEIPSFAVVFTNDNITPLIGDVAPTFARNSIGTRVGADKLIKVMLANEHRINYDPVTGGPQGLLIESQRTNKFLRSEELDHAYWSRAGVTIGPDASNIPTPSGTFNADGATESALNEIHIAASRSEPGCTAGVHHTVSWFGVSGGRYLQLVLDDTASTNGAYANFDLSNGVIVQPATTFGAGSSASAKIERYANGFYRCQLTCIVNAGSTTLRAAANLQSAANAAPFAAYQGGGVLGVYFWGGQFEEGRFASSYIPTTSAAVTRVADTLEYPTTGWLTQGVGTLLAGVVFKGGLINSAVGEVGVVRLVSDDGSSHFSLRAVTDPAAPALDSYVQPGGIADFAGFAVSLDTAHGHVLAWNTNDFAYSANGAAVQTDASGAPPTNITKLKVLHGDKDCSFVVGRIIYYPKRLSNALLQKVQVSEVQITHVVTARYWRLDLIDGTLPDNLQIGRVFLGPHWKHAGTLKYGWSVTPLDESENDESYGGQDYPETLPKRRVLSFTLDYLTEAEMFDNPFAMTRANGTVKDVLAIPHEDGAYVSEQAVWGRLQALKPIVRQAVRIFQAPFVVRERL